MKKLLRTVVAVATVTFGFVQQSDATLPVFDPTNFIQNTLTAMGAVKGEVYQDTNLTYQYQMMLNQLKQAANLNPAAMAAQASTISGDIDTLNKYTDTMKALYGGLQSNAQYATKVQALITQSGKSTTQWFNDQATLISNNDQTAKQLFQQGNDVISHVSVLAKRRQEIQDQLNMSPTAEATAQLTTHMLDIVASQNSDMLQMMATKQQADSVVQAQKTADDQASNTAKAALQTQLDQQRATYNATIGTSKVLGQ
ncbi:type VI secretion protein [Paraburkholderia sp. Tr-20389]|uniref:type VI secretion protein n=1 Tax=Paraburkholderia sp. Tr-20389 TaxID=2703903 RepID=UPI00197CD664|nr:type VI secretion protein [Paraburkholderia sp. Tr-20389]MBN3754250.1 type VI secretion protein [Paraburkholderia sp. Tr-20389]